MKRYDVEVTDCVRLYRGKLFIACFCGPGDSYTAASIRRARRVADLLNKDAEDTAHA